MKITDINCLEHESSLGSDKKIKDLFRLLPKSTFLKFGNANFIVKLAELLNFGRMK